jgi:hypothetical protein
MILFWEDAMPREELEKLWFLRFVSVLMVGMICVGALPVLKNALFPIERTNR